MKRLFLLCLHAMYERVSESKQCLMTVKEKVKKKEKSQLSTRMQKLGISQVVKGNVFDINVNPNKSHIHCFFCGDNHYLRTTYLVLITVVCYQTFTGTYYSLTRRSTNISETLCIGPKPLKIYGTNFGRMDWSMSNKTTMHPSSK